MSFLIRPARPADAPFIVDANCRMALETEDLALDRPTVELGVAAVLQDSTKGLYFLAEQAGRPLGQLMVTFEWSDWRNGNLWWLQSVYVVPEFRRRGVFTALYQHLRALADESGAAGVRLYVEENNTIAQQTYRRLGMDMSHYRVMEHAPRKG
jgi:ribosomal protein S18 acetylase RimI-like enzyme